MKYPRVPSATTANYKAPLDEWKATSYINSETERGTKHDINNITPDYQQKSLGPSSIVAVFKGFGLTVR
jgi:hypothetical protein